MLEIPLMREAPGSVQVLENRILVIGGCGRWAWEGRQFGCKCPHRLIFQKVMKPLGGVVDDTDFEA